MDPTGDILGYLFSYKTHFSSNPQIHISFTQDATIQSQGITQQSKSNRQKMQLELKQNQKIMR